ncbi:MAG: hypothetical protein JXR65_09730 [Bacteroidales bacterium]|nr:hypothetical protein [Bacteroidales bacterium]
MKTFTKSSFLILLIFTLTGNLIAQTQNKPYKITFDYKHKTICLKKVKDIKEGDWYQVIVDSINLNLYKVSLTHIDTTLSKKQQTPTFGGNFNLDALSKLIAGISPSSTEITQENPNPLSLPWDYLKQKPTKIMSIKTTGGTTSTQQETDRSQSIRHTVDSVQKQEKETLSLYVHKIKQITFNIDSLKFKVDKLRLDSQKENYTSQKFSFDQALVTIENIRKNIADLTSSMTTSKTSYKDFSTAYKPVIKKDSIWSSNDMTIKDSYAKLLTTLSGVFTSVSADKANDLLSSVVYINNNNKFTFFPIQFMGEQVKLNLSLIPRKETPTAPEFHSQIIFPLPIKKYTVVGISFYGSTLHDEAYSTIKTKINDSTYQYNFIKEISGTKEIGIAALLRYGRKWTSKNNFGGHISIGAGISMSNKIKPRVLFGGGLSIGKKHMLAVDIGGIFGYVDRLSNTIDLTKTYLEKPGNITVSRLKIGGFISVGYIFQF